MQEVEKQEKTGIFFMKGKVSDILLPIIAIIGILICIELTYVYYKANFMAGVGSSFCTINEYIDCDGVARTSFSNFLGVPLSLWGMGFYFAVLGLHISSKWLKNARSYIFSFATFSVLMSITLAWVSSSLIHKICILCYVTYFLNIAIFFISKSQTGFMDHYKTSVKDVISFMKSPIRAVSLVILAVIFSVSLFLVNQFNLFVPAKSQELTTQSEDANPEPVNTNYEVQGNVLGSKNPKLIIHEYTDFQCPYCGISNSMMIRLVNEVDGVMVVHHDYPLDSACNSEIPTSMHKNACKVALYSRAAKEQGKYWEFNKLLFENQRELSDKKVFELANSVGLDVNALKKYANNPESMKQLKEDVKKANENQITATPTYIIGVKKYEGLLPYPELKKIVEENLK